MEFAHYGLIHIVLLWVNISGLISLSKTIPLNTVRNPSKPSIAWWRDMH